MKLAARNPAAGRRDDPVGQRHHLRRGPIVPLQPHDRGVGQSTGELEQEARCGAGERVDGLVRVTDHRQVVSLPQPRGEHTLLQWCDVLVFIDNEAAVPVAEFLRYARVVFDRGRGVQEQVIEVEQHDAVTAGLQRLISGVDVGHLAGVQRRFPRDVRDGVGISLRGDQRCLRPLDFARKITDVVGGHLQAHPRRGLRHHRELAVEQFPGGLADDTRPEVLKLTAGRGVKRHRLHRTGADTVVELAQPAAHLTRRPLGERHGEHLPGRDVTGGDEVRDAAGDGAGLAGAGAGQHAQRTAGRQHGLPLLVVEAL